MMVDAAAGSRTKPVSLVVIHPRSSCQKAERDVIHHLWGASLPVDQRVYYVEPLFHFGCAPYLADATRTVVYDPDFGYPLDYVPEGERFVVTGGLIYNCVWNISEAIILCNIKSGNNLEFHFPLDAIATDQFVPDKLAYITGTNPGYNSLRESINRFIKDGLGIANSLDQKIILDSAGKPLVTLNWHSTLAGMLSVLGSSQVNPGRE